MNNKETGGPAFPQSNDRVVHALSVANSSGMTLRDYFAAKAMQGITSTLSGTAPVLYDAIADDAYTIADAMLKAREQ